MEEEIRRRCGVILHGHLHQQKARLASDPDRDVLQLAAGAAYASSKWANAYQLLELDPTNGEARVHFRLWDGHDWIPDRNRYQKAPGGVATLPLRRSSKAPAPRPMTPAERALSALFGEEFTTPTLNAWLSADSRRAQARSALAQAKEEREDRFDLLAVTLTQLGLVNESLFTSLIYERPQSAPAVTQVALEFGVTIPTALQAVAVKAAPGDALIRYSRLDLVVMLEELHIRRDRARRSKHDLDDLNDQINAVAKRLGDAPPPRVGAVVAEATLEARIAEGAFGTVWRARAPDGQTVAVKMFRPEQLKTNMAVWGFRRGVRAMQTFARRRAPPSLLPVLSVAEDELAFTMPFIAGATLEATDLTGWTLTQRLDRFQIICEAIQFAHEVQVIHRDLKPANIMIDRAGAPVVIDFDAADVGHATLLSSAFNVGTVGYTAPEQARGARADVRMDVYSLGRVLHYLLNGGHSAVTVAVESVVRSELSVMPPALVALVLHACALSPGERTPSVAELLREMKAARAALGADEPQAARLAGPLIEVRRSTTRRLEPTATPPSKEAAQPSPMEMPSIAPPLPSPEQRVLEAVTEAMASSLPEQDMVVPQPPPPSWTSSRLAQLAPPLGAPPVMEPSAEVASSQATPVAAQEEETEVEPEQAPRRSWWGWRGLGAVVVVLSAVGAWAKFGEEEETTPVEPVAEVAPVPEIGPCELAALGGPTGETYKPNISGLDMPFVGLSDGQFCMGSPDGVGHDDERPQHPVKVAACLMGKSEVTQAQWRAVVKAAKIAHDVDAAGLKEDPSGFEGDKLPVENLSWCDVVRFANGLSRLDGRAPVYEITTDDPEKKGCTVRWVDGADGYRLPTEAEWEYAARAGTTKAFATGDDESALAQAGWYGGDNGGNSGGKTHEVCTAPQQPWGLCDLYGNVWEWVFDVYDSGTYARRAADLTVDGGLSTFDGSERLAEFAASDAPRVLRGGSWSNWPEYPRSADRRKDSILVPWAGVGFRLLLSSPERP